MDDGRRATLPPLRSRNDSTFEPANLYYPPQQQPIPSLPNPPPRFGQGPPNPWPLAPAGEALAGPSTGPPLKRPSGTEQDLLNPPAKRQSKWTETENTKILQLRGVGMKWDEISKQLPGRSSTSCRLHYQNYLERRSVWSEESKVQLARIYDRHRKEWWSVIALELGVPWRAAEQMHWELGSEGMAARANYPPLKRKDQAHLNPLYIVNPLQREGEPQYYQDPATYADAQGYPMHMQPAAHTWDRPSPPPLSPALALADRPSSRPISRPSSRRRSRYQSISPTSKVPELTYPGYEQGESSRQGGPYDPELDNVPPVPPIPPALQYEQSSGSTSAPMRYLPPKHKQEPP